MKLNHRELNRSDEKVKADVVATKKLLREDVLEILQRRKKRADAVADLRAFLAQIPDEAISYQGSRELGIARVISDIDSYGVQWQK